MARYTGPVCKLCRREKEKLFLKGERCLTDKCAMERRPFVPGEHGKRFTKPSQYSAQLREKQKAKRIFGVLEKQFKRYYDIAAKQKGITGENLLKILETRLDNIVYHLGFARSRAEARQSVKHGHFTVNSRRVDIPSYRVKQGDIIGLTDHGSKVEKIKESFKSTSKSEIPSWLEVDSKAVIGKILNLPTREQIDISIKEELIVELYSK
ncbi:30S ribosomal protein S4 [Candidatus Oleimmundimicrobium sp.]|uniref:30S ribosomal protein S4 n=1 Tax=Candidatus Oleimmundimicrobium sp. TaxID=3060597 RepID=UPI00271A2DC5|nr:30S ribosomal protein S4 [Candidatus Oleimmundimicrobium sp.]MDO8886036.1 30S ribosomal protein S4 [Candidatus Oleimmundimicrobium sp.]